MFLDRPTAEMSAAGEMTVSAERTDYFPLGDTPF